MGHEEELGDFWESYLQAKAELEADEAAVHDRVKSHADQWAVAWNEVLRKVQDLEGEE